MNYEVLYDHLDPAARKAAVDVQEKLGRRMISDTFIDLAGGSGSMIFTDEPAETPGLNRDILSELDKLKARVTALEGK